MEQGVQDLRESAIPPDESFLGNDLTPTAIYQRPSSATLMVQFENGDIHEAQMHDLWRFGLADRDDLAAFVAEQIRDFAGEYPSHSNLSTLLYEICWMIRYGAAPSFDTEDEKQEFIEILKELAFDE